MTQTDYPNPASAFPDYCREGVNHALGEPATGFFNSLLEPHYWSIALPLWPLMAVIGGAICVVVELVVLTPILIAFRRYRWRWLNGWSAAAIGFAVGVVIPLAYHYLEIVLAGQVTGFDWTDLFPGAEGGVVGLVSAVIFRLIAVREVSITLS